MNNIDIGKEPDKTSFSLACCGLRYGKTKLQAEQIKQMLEEYKIENLSIHIVDSESQQRINKAIEYLENYDIFKEFNFPLMKRDMENQIKSSINYEFNKSIKESLLEILKGDSNE